MVSPYGKWRFEWVTHYGCLFPLVNYLIKDMSEMVASGKHFGELLYLFSQDFKICCLLRCECLEVRRSDLHFVPGTTNFKIES